MTLPSPRRFLFTVSAAATLALALSVRAQTPRPSVYIVPDDNFETYISAAIIKKNVPVRVVAVEDNADYVLRAKPVEVHEQTTGSKFARCLFAYCAGIEDSANVSVELMKGERSCGRTR